MVAEFTKCRESRAVQGFHFLFILALFWSLAAPVAAQISFSTGTLQGTGLSKPTSLQFGPDDRLYVAEQGGDIHAFTIVRNGVDNYQVTTSEPISLIKNDVENHNDDGSGNTTNKRQVTGLLVTGTASNPVLYVSSSDWRIGGAGGGTDKNLDTNSGVISRLTCTGGIDAGVCQAWDHVDLVRGLPRSEENHSTNGMDLDEAANVLYVMSGGHANKGAPSNNFAGTPEYYLSGALLSVDLNMIESMPIQVDTSTTPDTRYVYDLPTLDDPDRANVDGITDRADPAYTGIDVNDPFGGNNGLNQAVPDPLGPVQIHSPGYRNAYDIVLTQSGDLYTWDNGPNGGWGGQPLIRDNLGNLKGVQLDGTIYDPSAGDYCTNEFSEDGSNTHGDQLHLISSAGYYGGHPVPIRAFPELAGIIVYEDSGSGWVQVGPTHTLSELLPAGLTIGDFPDDPEQCDYQTDDATKYLEKVNSSTNGMAEYLGSNFSGSMQGDILAAAFNGNIYRCKPDGAGGLVDLPGSHGSMSNDLCEILFTGFGSTPLDVATLGDGAPFPGTVWVANIGGNNVTVFEPDDFLVCDPSDPSADSDGDGFTNSDENDNGTDPCSGASKPQDFDNDGVSNLNDADDDNDGIDDVADPFALDAQNGLGTAVPLDYPFFNTDPGTGLFGLGFTGLMIPDDSATSWIDLYDPGQLAAGGTSGLMTVENVSSGDTFESTNTQDNGFLFGVDIDANTPPVSVSTRLLPPYFDSQTPQPWQSFGLFIGTGDQDNYLKIVFNDNGGAGGVEVLIEEGGTASATQYADVDWGGQAILGAGQVDLILSIDPQAGTAQPRISLDQGATTFDLGVPLPLPSAWLDPFDSQGLAVGLISTSNGPGGGAPAFSAIWDFLKVELDEVTATGDWLLIDDQFNEVRHEGASVQAGDKFYVLGGRESQAVRIYDPAADTWTTGASSPILLHHFQAVELDGLIYAIGAMTGGCCSEPEAEHVYIYDPLADAWTTGPAIPASRARGGGAAIVHDGRIYWISGNTNGHQGPVSAAVDRFDPTTGTFTALADIPHPRDHFYAVVADAKIYAVGGRRSGEISTFEPTVPEVDVYDIATDSWTTLPAGSNIPTPRAAAATGRIGNEIIVAGGESGARSDAHPETEALDLASESWRSLSDMLTPRHAAQAIVSNGGFYVVGGSPQRGGPGGSVLDLEALFLFGQTAPSANTLTAGTLDVPTGVDFGTTTAGSQATQVVTLTHAAGDQALVIAGAQLSGSTAFSMAQAFEPVVIPPGGNAAIEIVFDAPEPAGGDSSVVESATLTITEGDGTSAGVSLTATSSTEPTVLFRVNVGGTELAAIDGGPNWTADTEAGNSAYLVNAGSNDVSGWPTISFDASVPSSTPPDVFLTERWDNTNDAAGEMAWGFPTGNGEFRVRLHMKNGWDGSDQPGERVFDVAVEGSVPAIYDDIDLSAQFGHRVGTMLPYDVTVSDGSLDLQFIHGAANNPTVNAIEILALDGGSVNQPPQVEAIGDQTNREGDLSELAVVATDSDGPDNLAYAAAGLPPGLGIEPTNGQIFGTIADGAASGSPYGVTITVGDGLAQTQVDFDWFVTTADADAVLYRINVGGDQVAAADGSAPDWAVDNETNPSSFRSGGGTSIYSGNNGNAHAGSIVMTDPSIPPSAPAAMFNIERWDAETAPEMTWALPVSSGSQVEVRLYFAELFGGIDAAGERVFDVSVEGSVPAAFDDIDPFAAAGAKGAFMRSTTLTMADDTLDLVFVHGVENPALKGIELIELGASGGNTPPEITNPGDQTSTEGDSINLQIGASDVDTGDTLSYGASGLPPELTIDPATGLISGTIATEGAGSAFAEQGGLVVIEMESADSRPSNWVLGPDEGPTSPNIDNPGAATGGQFLVWEGSQFLGSPGTGIMTYPVEITNPGTYRFQWRSQVGNGTSSTEHNDSWLKIEADAFFGEKSGGSIVCPKGFDSNQNDCTGSAPEGSGADGWFKIYSSGSTNWTWSTNTSDNDAHQIFARFDSPGVYNVLVSARSSSHAIDRMVLFSDAYSGTATDTGLAESPRAGGAAENSPYSVTLSVDDGTAAPVETSFTWTVDPASANDPPTADAGGDQIVNEGASVTLDGSASSDPDTDPLGYAWTQTSGPTVSLSDASDPQPSFTAPQVSSQQELVFELTVDDGAATDSDTVSVFVNDITTGGGSLADAEFEQVALSAVSSDFYTTVTVGPDGKLYAMDISGNIHRWSINPDGTLANDEQVITTITDAETGSRLAIGLEFDPSATAGNLITWATHSDGGQGGGDKFSAKITRLTGPDLGSAQDFVTGLPRSTGDHVVNSLVFGPDGDLYVNVGSMSAMGALDGSWNDTETLLSAATLRVDLDAIASPPLDVQTEDGGSYDPFASGAAVTIFGQGVRNAYDLVWHSNGFLYVPTNGSAPGNTPASDPADVCPDGSTYAGPSVPALSGVSEQPDYLFLVEQGGYYGHPNPTLCNYVLNGGNPTSGSDPFEVTEYPAGTAADTDYLGAVLDFAEFGSANSHSPNGVIEYAASHFGGGLQGSLLVARYHKSDIVAIRPNASDGAIAETGSGMPGMTGLNNPLDLAEDPANGNLYVSEAGSATITLLRPLNAALPDIDAEQSELIFDAVQGTTSDSQTLLLENRGSADLAISGLSITGADAADFQVDTDPTPVTLAPGEAAGVSVSFAPAVGKTGSLSASLTAASDDPDEPTFEIGLYGLATQGLEGNNEPPLQQIVDTLGYAIDVGGTALSLGTGPAPIGDEVETRLFRKPSGDSPVTIEAVARYSPDWVLPFGWYEPDGTNTPALNQVGELSGASSPPEHQTLFPELVTGSTSFDPGSAVFGLYTTSPTHTAYSEDALNTGSGIVPHSVRIYPLADRSGNAIPNAFLVGFEEASNGDYQDYVFVIRNVVPAQPAGSGCAPISPLDCPDVPVNLPLQLNWSADEGGLGDATDTGTGFTMVDPPTNGDGYLPANLAVNTAASTLEITTTDGIQFGPTGTNPNSLDNGLGVAFDADFQSSLAETTLVGLPAPPDDFAQAGLWLFLNESHYVKLVALSRDTDGWEIQLNYEQGNATVTEVESPADAAGTGDDVRLALDIDPVAGQVTGLYSVNGGPEQILGPIDVDPSLLAGTTLPDGSGPFSFAGVFATHRSATQQVFAVDDFALGYTGTPANQPPSVTNPGSQVSLEGDVVSLQVAATDPDGDDAALTYGATGLPDGLSIDASTGEINGTIAAGAAASSPFVVTVSVSDAEDTTDASFNWTVGVPGDINSGLLLHWTFDETGGLVAGDASGNGRDGTVSGSGASFVAGQLGNAIQLDGAAGFVADEDAENFLNGLAAVTVSTWVKADATATDEGIFTTTGPDNKDEFLAMRYDAAGFAGGENNVIKTGVGNGEASENFAVLESSADAQTTDWQHLALVWQQGSAPQLYIDGALDSPSDLTGTMGSALSAVDRLWVGRASKFTNGESGWSGLIDDFRVYGRALSAGEVLELSSGSTGGNSPPAVNNPGDQTSTDGDVVAVQIVASDADTEDTLSYSAAGLPDGLSIDAGTGLISGTISSTAVAASPFTVEVIVTDGTDPTTVTFGWTVQSFNPVAAADVEITPTGSLTATTFNGDAFVISNVGDYPITSVSIDLSTALLADNVFDPVGDAGDAGAKCLTANSGAAATGFVAPPDACVAPFSGPHDGGFEVLTIAFTDFGPGESFGFNTDVDPTSIKNATGTGEAGAVSGLELSGATVSVTFDDGGGGLTLDGRTFQIAPNSQGGSVASVREIQPAAPSLSVSGVTLTGIDLASPAGSAGPASHGAAVIPSDQASQSVVVDTGNAGDSVRLLHVEAALLAVNGFELEPFEANEAIVVDSYVATTGADGTVSIPVTLGRTDATFGGFNYFVAVNDGIEGAGPVSNFAILELDTTAGPNQPPTAVDDLVAINAGQLDVLIDLLVNDSDSDGVLDASSITIVDAPTQGTLTPGALGVYEYDHTGSGDDSFSYTVDDNDGATSNLATVLLLVQPPALPNDDVDGDGMDNITDNDDDNDGLLDTEDPFALDADNGLTTGLPVRLTLFSDDPGTGLFGLGFTGLMSNGVIGGTQGADYLDLFESARIFVNDDPAGSGTLTVFDVTAGDAFTNENTQEDAFQLGLDVDVNTEPFVVHARMDGPFFDGATPQNFQSQGMFIGTGDQDNYLKMVIDGAANNIELLLEVGGAQDSANSDNFGGAIDFVAADTVDLYLVVDTSGIDTTAGTVPVDARVALNDGAIQSIATVEIPSAWLDAGDDFGLAAGLIATSFGSGPVFDATWDTFEVFHLAADDVFMVAEESATTALDVLANDFDDGSLTIDSVTTPDAGGTAVVNGGVIDYTPAADFAGVETFTYTISDGDGRTATAAVAVTVEPVNDAPSITLGGDQPVLEDAGPQTVAGFATGFDPGGGADEAGQAIDEFVVTNDNAGLFAGPPAIAPDGTLSYTPADDANGVATVTVQVRDDGGTANGGEDLSPAQTFVIDVAPVNDAPSITIGGDQSVPEDAGPQTAAGFATGFDPGGGADEAGQAVDGFVVANDNAALFAAAPAIAPDGTLSYTPAPDANGAATVTVQVRDDGGTANGGDDLSPAQTFVIDVTPVNDDPVVTPPAAATVLEDNASGPLAFMVGDVETAAGALSVTASSDNQALIPDGNITLGGSDDNRTVGVTPLAEANGSATITLAVDDGTGGSATADFTVTVNPVNDAPSIALGTDQSVPEDAGLQTVAGFATGFDPGGGADEAGQTIDEFVVTNDNAGLFAAQPTIDAAGTLSYIPADDATGTAEVTVQVRDDGGTANGGGDLSPAQTFVVDVTPVNDAPSIALGADQSVLEDAGLQTVAGFASGFDPGGGADEAGQTIDGFVVTNDNAGLFAAQPTIDAAGTLSYIPADDATGTAEVTVQVRDDGGTANGGDDLSPAQTFVIDVTPVNDAPSFVAGPDVSVVEDSGAYIQAWASSIAVGPLNEALQSPMFELANDNNGLFSTQPTIDPAGVLSFTPVADTTGTATVTVQVRDDGGTPNGGDDLSDPQTFTIEVTELADVSITKTADPDPVLTGGTVTYTITVDNAGPSTASNVVVAESLPAGVSLQATSGCAEDPVGVPTCSLGDVPESSQASFTVTVAVGEDTLGNLVNNVWVETDTTETSILDNAADATVTARQAPALAISPTEFDFGTVLTTESASTTFTLTNTGDPITTIALDAPALTGSTDPAFSIVGGDCAANTELVGGDAGCTVEIEFDPVSVSAGFDGVLEIASDTGVVSAALAGSSELPDWVDGFDNTDPGSMGFEQGWTFQAFDGGLNPLAPTTAEVTDGGYLQIRDPDAVFALGFVTRTFGDTRTSALVNADGFGSGSDSGDGLDNQIDQGVVGRFDPMTLSGYAAYMRMELNEQQLVLIKFDSSNIDPALVDLRGTVATSTDADWTMGRMYEVELDLVDQPDGSVRVIARAMDADTGALLERLEFIDPVLDKFEAGYSGVVAIANATGLNGTFDATAAVSSFATAELAPTTIDFGSVPIGFAGQQAVTLGNPGNAPLAIDGFALTGAAAGDYSLQANTCASPLPAGASCSFEVAFAAGITGQREAAVAVDTSASTSPDTVLVTSSVFAPQLAVNPASADFGSVPIGETSAPVTLTVSNAGNAVTQLTLTGIAISGDFELVGGDCSESTVLNGGQGCDIEVAFEPQSAGALNGTLDIDGDIGSIGVGLAGIGLQGAGLAVSPTKYVFGTTTLGESAATSFTVANTGDPASSLALTGLFTTGNPDFGITGGSCSAGSTVLAGQETCTVDVLFGPTALGFAAGALAVESDAGDSFVPLVGEGTGAAQIAIDPTAFDFGTVGVGEPESVTFKVTNAGGVASSLQLDEVAVTGDRFDVIGGSCTVGTVLDGAETCTVVVEFAPLVTGDYSGELSVASTAGSVQAALSAAGLNEVDLSLQISAQSTRAVAGADAVYEMVVENLETVGDATGVTIESTLTDGVTLVVSSGCVEATAIPVCTIGDLAAGQSATVTLNVAVPSSAQGELNLDAAVRADQSDPNPGNNGSGSSSLVIVQSDLSVALTPFIEFIPAAMTEVEFELVYGNIGPSDVTGAAIGTNFDAMLTDIEWTCQAGPGAACVGAGSGDLDGTIDLAAGSAVTFTVIAALSDPDIDADGIHLSVVIEPDGVIDPNPVNNEAQAEIRTGVFADSFEAAPAR